MLKALGQITGDRSEDIARVVGAASIAGADSDTDPMGGPHPHRLTEKLAELSHNDVARLWYRSTPTGASGLKRSVGDGESADANIGPRSVGRLRRLARSAGVRTTGLRSRRHHSRRLRTVGRPAQERQELPRRRYRASGGIGR